MKGFCTFGQYVQHDTIDILIKCCPHPILMNKILKIQLNSIQYHTKNTTQSSLNSINFETS